MRKGGGEGVRFRMRLEEIGWVWRRSIESIGSRGLMPFDADVLRYRQGLRPVREY